MSRLIAFALLGVLAVAGCAPAKAQIASAGDARRGKIMITTYACGTCHQVPGVVGAHGMVGPPLDHMARRTVIAGLLPNTPPNMIQWLRAPQSVVPGNAMPDMGIGDQDARDLTAYLATLK
jgi:cytochrome c2